MTTDFTVRGKHIYVYCDELDEARCLFVPEGKDRGAISASVVDLGLDKIQLCVEEDSGLNPGDRLALSWDNGQPTAMDPPVVVARGTGGEAAALDRGARTSGS